jgi:hypothetical protein
MKQDLAETKSKLPEAVTGRAETESSERPKKGGIPAALLRSPMVGADLDLTRPFDPGRKVDLPFD